MKLQRINKEDFDKIYAQLVENFVPKERRDYADAKALLERSDYSVYHTVDGDEKIGFITIWSLDGFDFIEHFVTYPNYRNQGYGSKILALLKKSGKNLILEAELPENDIQKRRIAFYERCGFVKNPFDYVQPAYRKGENGVPMVLMSYPCELRQPTKTVSEIYFKVYNVSKK